MRRIKASTSSILKIIPVRLVKRNAHFLFYYWFAFVHYVMASFILMCPYFYITHWHFSNSKRNYFNHTTLCVSFSMLKNNDFVQRFTSTIQQKKTSWIFSERSLAGNRIICRGLKYPGVTAAKRSKCEFSKAQF